MTYIVLSVILGTSLLCLSIGLSISLLWKNFLSDNSNTSFLNKHKFTFTKLLPTLTFLTAIGSLYFGFVSYKRQAYDDEPSFNVVQNLWSLHPSFELVNESKKKLRHPPHPTYLMTIPSKIYWYTPNKKGAISSLVLTPISYTNISEQVDTGNSIGRIETSKLPKNFFGKKGARDFIYSRSLKISDNLRAMVITFPMLAIAVNVNYQYWNSDKNHSEYFMTIPTAKIKIKSSDYAQLTTYLSDNADLEVVSRNNHSIYIDANNKVYTKLRNVTNEKSKSKKTFYFIGGKKGAYSYFLKEFNKKITMNTNDPLTSQ